MAPPTSLLRAIETQSLICDRVLVSFSGGKDSVATLDLCMRFFREVEGFFMYQVEGLSFQDSIIRYYEDRYGIPIHKIPHFQLSEFLRYGSFRPFDLNVPIISVKETYDYIRDETGFWWIAAGERINDSLWRRGMIKGSGTIDLKRGRFFPVAEWSKQDVLAYIRQRKLRTSPESAKLGFSFRSLQGRDMALVKKFYPEDYQKIKTWFPLIDASILNYEMRVETNG